MSHQIVKKATSRHCLKLNAESEINIISTTPNVQIRNSKQDHIPMRSIRNYKAQGTFPILDEESNNSQDKM